MAEIRNRSNDTGHLPDHLSGQTSEESKTSHPSLVAPYKSITITNEEHTNRGAISCQGVDDINSSAALGHPKVWLRLPIRSKHNVKQSVSCHYCGKVFVIDKS